MRPAASSDTHTLLIGDDSHAAAAPNFDNSHTLAILNDGVGLARGEAVPARRNRAVVRLAARGSPIGRN